VPKVLLAQELPGALDDPAPLPRPKSILPPAGRTAPP